MSRPRIALFGGSGFVGTVLANQLVRADYGINLFTRDRQHARALWLLPDTDVVELDVADEERVAQALVGCTAAVNLIGILNERRDDGVDFHRAHVGTVEHIIKACKHARVPHLLHMSALQAGPQAPSHYLRSKAEAERLLQAESGRQFRTTVLRPSVIFGPHDSFLNRFAALLKLAPHVMPLTSCEAQLQPVYVGDVVASILALLRASPRSGSTVVEIGGPQIMTLRAIVEYVAALIERPTSIVPLSGAVAGLLAWAMEFVPGKPLSRDNLRSLSVASVCTGPNGLLALGIRPTPLEEIVPDYLSNQNLRGRYARYRVEAGIARRDGDNGPQVHGE